MHRHLQCKYPDVVEISYEIIRYERLHPFDPYSLDTLSCKQDMVYLYKGPVCFHWVHHDCVNSLIVVFLLGVKFFWQSFHVDII